MKKSNEPEENKASKFSKPNASFSIDIGGELYELPRSLKDRFEKFLHEHDASLRFQRRGVEYPFDPWGIGTTQGAHIHVDSGEIGRLILNKTNANELHRKLTKKGLKPLIISKPLIEVLGAIKSEGKVSGYNINELFQDPAFRFLTYDEPESSLAVSEAIASIITYSKKIMTSDISRQGVAKRNKNADDFARSMRDMIEKIQSEDSVSSMREIVEALNDRQIRTYRDTQWHLSTVQNLYKRWKQLGITPPKRGPNIT